MSYRDLREKFNRELGVIKSVATRATNRANKLAKQMELMEKEYKNDLKELNHYMHMNTDLNKKFVNHLIKSRDIYKVRLNMNQCLCGIYLLEKNDAVIYVGQSVNVFTRVGAHMGDKDFDSFTVFGVKREYLDCVEDFLIKLLRPKTNGPYKNGNLKYETQDVINNLQETDFFRQELNV